MVIACVQREHSQVRPMIKRLTKDFETRSAGDLRKIGAYNYSMLPSTRPTCLAFKEHGCDTVYFLPFHVVNRMWEDQDPRLKALWIKYIDEGYEFSAQNSFFERCIYDNIMVVRYGWPPIDPRKRRCTAAKAAACALPRSLEGVGEALRLAIQKDKRGYAAMMATCKPTAQWNAWITARKEIAEGRSVGPKKRQLALEPEPSMFLEPDASPDVWETLYTYCKIDVRTEELVDLTLPDLIPSEQEIWFLNQEINWRGLNVDLPTIRKVIGIMDQDKGEKLTELDALTMGLVTSPNSRKSVLDFLELEGIFLPDLKAKTVEDALNGFELSEDMHRLLEIRKALSMASTKKYYSMRDRADTQGVVRDIVLFCAASTGRSGGTGINPYNFPRGLIHVDKDRPYATVDNVIECDHDILTLLYGSSLPIVFSAILRNMIIPEPGSELFVADFSKIELAVLWWLADNFSGLEILRAGRDPYIYQAAENLGKTYEEVERGIEADEMWAVDARQLGKAQILGCGFRLGWKGFRDTAYRMYRLKLTNRQALDAVKSYRGVNDTVVDLWEQYENAAVSAIETGQPVRAGKCTFFTGDRFLWVELPSGRRLAYREPQIVMKTITYTALETDPKTGEEVEVERVSKPKKTVQFFGLDKSRKKLQTDFAHGGVWTENIVQAVARDLMMDRLPELERSGYQVKLEVYDEALCSRPTGLGSVEEFRGILCDAPIWAEGLPLDAKGWKGPRYRK